MRPNSHPFALLGLIFALLMPVSAVAQHQAGRFDHYLLALSWIPAWCAIDGDERRDPRCRDGRQLGWSVHGLWPQYADGDWPEYCHTVHPDPNRRQTGEQADLFGTSGAAWHQWNKHGRCTGLSAGDYYALTREAIDALSLPAVFAGVSRALRVDPDVVEAAFIESNPGLSHDMLVTTCPDGDLVELRLCLTRDLQPRPCAAATLRRECRRSTTTLLPLR